MRRLTEVKNLSILSAGKLGEDIKRSLQYHLSKECKFCTNYNDYENCSQLLTLKQFLNGTTVDAKYMIYDKAKLSVSQILGCSETEQKNTESRKLNFFITWLFDNLKLDCELYIVENHHEEEFTRKLGKQINGVIYLNKIDRLEDHVRNLLQCANTLQVLRFEYHVNLTPDTMSIIGERCTCLKSIAGLFSHIDYMSGIKSLLFNDSESQHLIRNTCCSTLVEVYIYFRDWSEECEILRMEAFKLLLEHVTNFSNQVYFFFDVDSVCKHEITTKIRQIIEETCILNSEKILKMQMYCPLLKILTATINDVEVMRLLPTIKTLTDLTLHDLTDDSLLYEGLLTSNWSNLLSLSVSGFNSHIQILNIDVVAGMLVNLENLFIIECSNVTWENETLFKSLKFISVSVTSSNLNWTRSFFETIVRMRIYDDSIFGLDEIPNLVSGGFPHLEELYVWKLIFDAELVKNAIMNNPKLYSLGSFGKENEKEVKECRKYFKQQNIHCIFDY